MRFTFVRNLPGLLVSDAYSRPPCCTSLLDGVGHAVPEVGVRLRGGRDDRVDIGFGEVEVLPTRRQCDHEAVGS